MATPYIVARLVPESPVDGATFTTYLDGLQLQLLDAYTGAPWSDYVYFSPLILTSWPSLTGGETLSVVAAPTSASTTYVSANDYGATLTFDLDATDGISVGAYAFTSDQTAGNPIIPANSSLQVTQVTATKVTLNGNLPNYVPAGTVVTFLGNSAIAAVAPPASAFSFTLTPNSAAATIDGNPSTAADPLVVLNFANTTGVTVGMGVSGDPTIAPGTTVAMVTPTTVIVSLPLTGTPASVIFTLNAPYATLSATPLSGTPAAAPTKLKFASGGTNGIAIGMTLSVTSLIAPGTTVIGVTATMVTLSQPLLGPLTASPPAITFTFPLSSGIVQHIEVVGISFGFWGMSVVLGPASVATAVIPLNGPPPDYLDINISATRFAQTISIDNTFYNVLVQTDVPPAPADYQNISSTETSLYIALPPQPGTEPISLDIPTDGSAPPFDALYAAMQTALANDPVPEASFPLTPLSATSTLTSSTLTFTAGQTNNISVGMTVCPIAGLILPGATVTDVTATTISLSQPLLVPFAGQVFTFTSVGALISSPADCTRIAYDIVWSYQNTLPAPPDPLESLYTNPPNPGGSAEDDSNGNSNETNSLETDRQKFEGTLNSFYSTRNATAQRLTKFVAAVSAAVVCEQTSLNSAAALVEFPVDPSSNFAGEVESELLVEGLGISGTSGINFGVPAAFFYALGANLDQSTDATRRFQLHTGDTIERILQQFTTAENANVILDSEAFANTGLSLPPITYFQAARRLVALGVSAASTSPSATVFSGTPLAALLADWLSATAPATSPNPPLTYQNEDFNIWTQQLNSKEPQGYLYLDLDALTQGYVIPPFAVTPSVATTSGTTVTVQGVGIGIGVGMPVSGTNIAPGTTVTGTSTITTVTLSNNLASGGVSPTTAITFSSANSSVTVSPNASIGSGPTLTFVGTPGTEGITAGMSVSGTGIQAGTTVSASLTTTAISLSIPVTGTVSTTDLLTFNFTSPPTSATTTADCSKGTSTLTFSGLGGTSGITVGMAVFGPNIVAGTMVTSVSPTTATLTTVVSADVPSGSVITFVVIPAMIPPLTATTTADCPSETTTLTFTGASRTIGMSAGMAVFGTNIVPGTNVSSVTSTTVTLSTAVSGDVPPSSVVTFVMCLTATTSVDCPSGSTLTFPPGGTNGITVGMPVFGPNIAAGTTAKSVSSTTVTLTAAVSGDVPSGTIIAFLIVPVTLADAVAAWLPSTTSPPTTPPIVATLKQVTATEWTNFFTYTGNPTWLPPFTQPVPPGASPQPGKQSAGYVSMRIRAFIRAVQQFFTVSSIATSAQLPQPGSPPVFALPAYDPITLAAQQLPPSPHFSGFMFGNSAIAASDLSAAVNFVFPDDAETRAWLSEVITTINDLYQVATQTTVPNPSIGSYSLPNPASLASSVVEALYARGFRSAADISRLTSGNFQQALTGTVAYDFANALWANAQTIAPSTPSTSQSGGSFQPINPDGTLVNCIPPPCLSPTGPIAYLQELLNLSISSTCTDPWPTLAKGQQTLGDTIAARRGPLGTMLASCANLETPLPLIDIVNENLESLASVVASSSGSGASLRGTVYNTSDDELAGFALCKEDGRKEKQHGCHEAETIYAALPEYSTPATPVSANQSVEPTAFNALKQDFSTCCLPYSQALDVSRTYLRHFGSCRFEEMRTFRKCITEFTLDPDNPPSGFQSFLWRYPVRIDTAIEYLGITPEEYTTLFQGAASQPCAALQNNQPPSSTNAAGNSNLPGSAAVPAPGTSGAAASPPSVNQRFNVSALGFADTDGPLTVAEFLEVTCLPYCEFLELWNSGFVQSVSPVPGLNAAVNAFPKCEPCCLKEYELDLPRGDAQSRILTQLVIVIRLWRKLRELCNARYTFDQLYDIATDLGLFEGSSVNPDFIRQLAAFQMLRDQFRLPLVDPADRSTGSTGAARTHILALWAGPSAKKWTWAVTRLLEGVEEFAKCQYGGKRKRGDFAAHISGNLDALSRLAGFNPTSSSSTNNDTWNSTPGCTLRFAEVLAKMCVSDFRIGELLYLFNAQPPHECEDPFAQQDPTEALNYPLDLPESSHEHTLWKLREVLLCIEVGDEEADEWTWKKIAFEFHNKFGYTPPAGQDPLLSLGQHFFPSVLEAAGFFVSGAQRQYQASLTSTTNWSLPPGSPFQYNASTSQLWIELPLEDESVASKLSQLPQLNAAEQAAVQDLYFAPRVDLGLFAFLFPDWQSAERDMIEERDEGRRWSYFRRHFALAHKRRKAISEHLARHVASFAGFRHEHLEHVADFVLGHMLSDENSGAPWESDSGTPPSVMWPLQPAGSAVAALLGIAGTGLLGEYLGADADTRSVENQPSNQPVPTTNAAAEAEKTGSILWREVRAPLEAWGHQRDETNSPIPTVIPALGLAPSSSSLVDFKNGYAVATSDGQRLGGAQAIQVRWTGVLLVDREGEYAFRAGAPKPGDEEPDFDRADSSAWRVTLTRGFKKWLVLNHNWPGEPDGESWNPHLRRGAYSITVEYSQPAPDYSKPHLHPSRTGFQVKYRGPDTDHHFSTLPARHLYRGFQNQTLDSGITFLSGSKNAQAFLKGYYTSTLRDIRRTYQRAFKAVLFAGGFALSSRPTDEDRQSELGYFLANPTQFEGYAYYRNSSGTFTQHLADFDFDFLPLVDNYHASTPVAGDRSDPSLQRTQAMFDWWERIFDYCLVRRQVESHGHGPEWRLFYDAQVKAPANPAQLLGHIGADPKFSALDLRYFQDQSSPIYSVTDTDLEDERWLVRVWQAEQWIRRIERDFHPVDLAKARPDLWASDDPSAVITGQSQTGNANLLQFVDECCFTPEPRRYLDVKRLNDGLRLRGRDALIAYLCANDRVPLPWSSTTAYAASAIDLSDLLLLDVRSTERERASRIDEAITAVQNFIRRARLGLEPGWKITREFARLWDSRFENYRKWELCKRRELYRENWIEWDELEKARRIEAFRFLEDQLRTSTLTLAAPGGIDYWLDDDKPFEHAPELVQDRVPSELEPLPAPPQSQTREGLGTLGSPEYAAELTWLTPVPQSSTSTGSQPTGSTTGVTSASGTGTASGSPAPSSASQSTVVLAHTAKVQDLAQAAATGAAQPEALPFWMESAMQMGTTFLRIAAAGIPEASLPFKPHHDDAKTSCCKECGKHHPALVDEYYFWLIPTEFYNYTDQTDSQSNPDVSFTGSYQFGFQDSYYDQFQQQSAEWNDEDQVPPLLAKWQPNDGVRLAWVCVHNGQFQQPRKSDCYVAISTPADLVFLGRGADSLYFEVSGSTVPLPPGYGGSGQDTSPPGFRFDLPTDEAVALPQVAKPPAPDITYPGGLDSYPFFAYDEPGARLFPASWFSPSLLVAETLRGDCKFELALRWYKRSFDPLQNDCAWMVCTQNPVEPDQPGGMNQPSLPSDSEIAKEAYTIWEQHGRPANEQNEDWFEAKKELQDPESQTSANQKAVVEGSGTQFMGTCCDSTKISCGTARHRAVTLHYCETLLEWADRLMHRRNSPEAFQQARLLCDTAVRIAGPRPRTVLMPETGKPQPVSSFTPAYAPLNPRLMDLYSTIYDELGLIHSDESARRIRNGRLREDMYYFGDSPLREGWRTEYECCANEDCCNRPSPYRFSFQIQKALELAGRVHELESALLSAYEKLDTEALASIHAEQDREMQALGISIRQDQWRDADWQIQALQQTKEVNQTNLIYYNNLYQAGLINDENQNLSLATNAMQTRTAANIVEAFAESFRIVPDFFVGAMSTFSQIPIGTKLAGLFETIAKVMQTVAEIQSSTAAIDMTQAGWTRRSVEWFHQMQILPIEIQQAEMQIMGAHRRRDQAMQELNNQQRQIEHATEVLDFLRDKFTSTGLYLKLKKETVAMHACLYKLAHCAALEAQRAFNFELGHTTRHFLPEACWDELRGALVAGQRLQCALSRMEKAYFDENVRERELTKHFSLRMHFPEKFLELKATGRCEIELPEPMFDVDYPGFYMRRIRSIALTIPCVTGPYTGVHCRLTLLSSVTRIDPRVDPPATGCCCECGRREGYEGCPHDPRLVHSYGAREAIATSSGQNDSGLHELNFHDERYLPFEFHGAVSRWRIELPRENNYFPVDTLTDFIVHLNYTAREGGEMLRRAASKAAETYLPGWGWVFFDVRYEFPDAWQLLEGGWADEHRKRRLALWLDRKLFPYVPGLDEIIVDRVALVYDAEQEDGHCGCKGECNCPVFNKPAAHVVEFTHGDPARRSGGHGFSCVASDDWPDLCYGILETQLGPIGRDHHRTEVEFQFPEHTGRMERVFLLCRYRSWQRSC